MSNTRKARGSGQAPAERCTFCGRRLGRGSALRALRLRTGQIACARCRETGHLRRLACGHFALPGALIVNESGDGQTFTCKACAPGGQPLVNIADYRKA